MPKGDAQRVWFLRCLRGYRGNGEKRHRSPRSSSCAIFWIPCCTRSGPKDTFLRLSSLAPNADSATRWQSPRVSVRAMILAARRFGIAPPAKIKALERQWSKYRDQQGLDLYGRSLLLEDLADETDECRCKPSTSTLP